MAGIQLVMVIEERGSSERCLSILRNYGAQNTLVSAALGTATGDMLRLLGLSRSEKEVVFALCEDEITPHMMTALVVGVRACVLSTALSSISNALFRMNRSADAQKKEGTATVIDTEKYEVIVVIANRGCIDLVMDAARAAGATGGTVIHARGSGAREDNRFFSFSIADERDMFFIVAQATERSAIMQSILDGAGMNTPAKAVAFSLPVQHLAGFPQFSIQEK